MPKNVLIVFAHPRYEDSLLHKSLVAAIPQNENLVFLDLYELYPDFNIDISTEKQRLSKADFIIWQHPFYWYSCPPLLKQYLDMVLEFGWAYGSGGFALKDKYFIQVISTGGGEDAYGLNGRNKFTINEFLRPFEQTVKLCHGLWLPPFLVQGTHRLTEENRLKAASEYYQLLTLMLNGHDFSGLLDRDTNKINDQLNQLN
jgi:glutathione-regulated potassium-efflux system ancillary protein KefG